MKTFITPDENLSKLLTFSEARDAMAFHLGRDSEERLEFIADISLRLYHKAREQYNVSYPLEECIETVDRFLSLVFEV